MPIRIEYQPVEALGNAAYLGGLGQYQQRQQDMLFRQNALNQQNALAQQQLAARLAADQQDRLQRQNAMLFQAGQQQAIENLRQQNDMARLSAQQGFVSDQQKKQREWELADLATRREYDLADQAARVKEADAARLFGYEAATAGDIENEAHTAMGTLAKQRENMLPEGTSIYNRLVTDWGIIQNQRGQLRPAQFTNLVGRFMENLSKSGIESYIQQKPNLDQQFAQETVNVNGAIYSRDRSGAWRQITKQPIAETFVPSGAGFQKWLSDNRKNFPGATTEELATQYQQEIAAARLIDQMHAVNGQTAARASSIPQIQPQLNPSAMPSGLYGGASEAVFLQQQGTLPAHDIAAAPGGDAYQFPPDEEILANIDPEVRKRLTPERVAAAARLGTTNPLASAAYLIGVEVAREREEREQASRPSLGKLAQTNVDRIPAADRPLVRNLPHPKSRSEFDALPQGTEFVDPEGNIRRK